jgi:hypothetical protein
VSPQALTLLNDDVVIKQSRAFAERLIREGNGTWPDVVRRAWILAYGRPVSAEEFERSLEFMNSLDRHFRATELVGDSSAASNRPTGESSDTSRDLVLVAFCRALFNTNEFLYVD